MLGSITAEKEHKRIARLRSAHEPLKTRKYVGPCRHARHLGWLAILSINQQSNLVLPKLKRVPEKAMHIPCIVHAALQLSMRSCIVDSN